MVNELIRQNKVVSYKSQTKKTPHQILQVVAQYTVAIGLDRPTAVDGRRLCVIE